MKQLGISGVTFHSVVTRQEIGKVYDQADIFINGSRLDNMPVSVLEAFAAGLPVVSTAPEGMRYLIDHERTGLLSPPEDWRALATNVLRLLENPRLAARIIAEAHQRSETYHWTAVREQWLNLYASIAPKSKTVPSRITSAA